MPDTKPEAPASAPEAPAKKSGLSSRALLMAAAGAALLALLLKSSKAAAQEAAGPAPAGVPPEYWNLVIQSAAANGIPANILGGLISAESSWQVPNEPGNVARCGVPCSNSSCAAGLTQMKRAAVEDVGGYWEGICDPANAIEWGARYLRRKYDAAGGDWNAAIQSYNTGGNAYRQGARNPAYLASVMRSANRYGVAGLGELRLFRVRA